MPGGDARIYFYIEAQSGHKYRIEGATRRKVNLLPTLQAKVTGPFLC